MMTSKIRFTVILLAVMMMIWAISNQTYQVASLIGLGIGYLIWSHFKEGTVFLATQAFHKQDYERTKTLLKDIKRPEYLRKGRRNYYEFMLGNLALKEEDIQKAEYHFQIASRLPFRRPNDKAIVLVNLANINLRKKDFDRVRGYIKVARKLEVSSRVAQIINKIENEIPKTS
jgi:hypothetical protein